MDNAFDRCRLVVISPSGDDWRRAADGIAAAIDGGDIASLILWPGDLNERDFQRLCEAAVPAAQAADVAAIIAWDSRIAGRCGADGIHVRGREDLAMKRRDDEADIIVGADGGKNRHDALEVGEMRPDYVFFGRFGYDTRPDPHPRNIALASWWAELVEIPCIVMAGSTLESLTEAAATKAEFVAVSAAIFTGTLPPVAAVERANQILDETSPQVEGMK